MPGLLTASGRGEILAGLSTANWNASTCTWYEVRASRIDLGIASCSIMLQ